MSFRRKKVDPNAPPPPPRMNGLPPKPADLAAVVAAFQQQNPGVNIVTGFGFDINAAGKKGENRVGAWRLYAFTDDTELKFPTEFMGYPVERREIPTPFLPRK